MNKWSELIIANIASRFFKNRFLTIVPNCNWTGNESDMLAVTPKLKLIDGEIKISISDLKADSKKRKWRKTVRSGLTFADRIAKRTYTEVPVSHPENIWKHYYIIPEDIYKPDITDLFPSSASGLLVVQSNGVIHCKKYAKANKDAPTLSSEKVIDIARLTSIRYWRTREEIAFNRLNIKYQFCEKCYQSYKCEMIGQNYCSNCGAKLSKEGL